MENQKLKRQWAKTSISKNFDKTANPTTSALTLDQPTVKRQKSTQKISEAVQATAVGSQGLVYTASNALASSIEPDDQSSDRVDDVREI